MIKNNKINNKIKNKLYKMNKILHKLVIQKHP